jgi:hypothetical protein
MSDWLNGHKEVRFVPIRKQRLVLGIKGRWSTLVMNGIVFNNIDIAMDSHIQNPSRISLHSNQPSIYSPLQISDQLAIIGKFD